MLTPGVHIQRAFSGKLGSCYMCGAISVYSQQFQRTSATLLLSTDICAHFQDIRHGLLQLFISAHFGTVCINLGDVGAMAYSHSGQPLLTLRAFGVVDNIFCIFKGILDNVAVLRQRYGLNKSADEVAIIIEAYRTLRDRGPYYADEVVRDLLGKFAFVLYDSTSEALFTMADADDSVPFFWGTAADDYLVLSDEPNVLKEGCGKSFTPFPRGCYFSTSGGLQSFERPLNKLMPMPRVERG